MSLKPLTWTPTKDGMANGYSGEMCLFCLIEDDSFPKSWGPIVFLSTSLPLAGDRKFQVVDFEEGKRFAATILTQFVKDLQNG